MTDPYLSIIKANLANIIESTNLVSTLGPAATKRAGKVRDCYETESQMVLVTTDRVSAFDRILASIPFKGTALNLISAFWFQLTKTIIPNHVVAQPDENIIVARKCKVFPIEFVVRGYLTGTTATSIWTNYAKGVRDYCGHQLPEGLLKNQKLEKPIVTPTTKEEAHDRLITPKEIVAEGWMNQEDWDFCSAKALELFKFGQKIAFNNGLLLVDTKYEFGRAPDGSIILVDEIHTPDSSRYWIAQSYEERFQKNEPPENIDKDILRNWFNSHCDPYQDEVLPAAPEDLVITLSRRYIELFELITGEQFPFDTSNAQERIKAHLTAFVKSQQ